MSGRAFSRVRIAEDAPEFLLGCIRYHYQLNHLDLYSILLPPFLAWIALSTKSTFKPNLLALLAVMIFRSLLEQN
jgi:hypothetical protein